MYGMGTVMPMRRSATALEMSTIFCCDYRKRMLDVSGLMLLLVGIHR